MWFALALIISIKYVVAQNTCYFPNSQIATGNYPCNPSAAVSVCCGAGSTCLDNKICLAKNQQTIRGACTDSSWSSPLCPQWCTDANTGGTDLVPCSNSTGSTADYCCDHTNKCCDSGIGRFKVLPSDPTTSAIWISTATAFSVVSQSSSLSSSTASLSTSATSSNNTPSSQSDGLSTGAQAGIGVGVTVGVLFLLGLFSLLWWRRRRSNERMDPTRGIGQDYNAHTNPQYDQKISHPTPAELSEQTVPAELPGHHRYELPADGSHR